MRTIHCIAALGLLAGTAVACGNDGGGGEGVSSSDEVVSLTVSAAPTTGNAQLYIAQAKGYFEDENLEIEIVPAVSAGEVQQLVASGNLDAAFGNLNAGFLNGLANGLETRLVGGKEQMAESGEPHLAILALADGPIGEVQDLRGQTVVVPGGDGGLTAHILDELLDQGGLGYGDITATNLGGTDALAAVTNGAAQASLVAEPLLTQSLIDGSYAPVGDIAPIIEVGTPGGVIVGPNLLSDDRDAGVAFLRALLRATRDDLQGDWTQDEEVAGIIAEATAIPVESIESTPATSFEPDMTVAEGMIPGAQEFWRDRDLLEYPHEIEVSEIVDHTLLDEALESYTS